MSLFWKRTNLPGAIAGLLSGALTVIIWDYIPIIGGQTPYVATGLYSLVVGFIISLLVYRGSESDDKGTGRIYY